MANDGKTAAEMTLTKRFGIAYADSDLGSGHFLFYEKAEFPGQVYCASEGLDKEQIKKILCAFVDDCIIPLEE